MLLNSYAVKMEGFATSFPGSSLYLEKVLARGRERVEGFEAFTVHAFSVQRKTEHVSKKRETFLKQT